MHSTDARLDFFQSNSPSIDNSFHQIGHHCFAHSMQCEHYSTESDLTWTKFEERELLERYFSKIFAEVLQLVTHPEQVSESPNEAIGSHCGKIKSESIQNRGLHLQHLTKYVQNLKLDRELKRYIPTSSAVYVLSVM
jgi:hypothetical protein